MRAIKLDDNNIVVGVKQSPKDFELNDGYFISETGEQGQIMQTDGTFITPEPIFEPEPYNPSNAEIAQMISDLQADLIIAGVI